MGLYGSIIVVPRDPDYWPPAHRELAVTLDDILIEDGQVAPFSRERDDVLGDGPLRQPHAREAASPTSRSPQARRGRTAVPHQHGQHARLQRRGPRRSDEARRRRQRPLRARDLRGVGRPRSVGACRGRRSLRHAGEAALEHRTPERTYELAADHRRREESIPGRRTPSRRCAQTRSGRGTRADRSLPGRRAGQDDRLRGRDGLRGPRRARSSTRARCTPKS